MPRALSVMYTLYLILILQVFHFSHVSGQSLDSNRSSITLGIDPADNESIGSSAPTPNPQSNGKEPATTLSLDVGIDEPV